MIGRLGGPEAASYPSCLLDSQTFPAIHSPRRDTQDIHSMSQTPQLTSAKHCYAFRHRLHEMTTRKNLIIDTDLHSDVEYA